jgi:molybdate transport system substrate-binding protein
VRRLAALLLVVALAAVAAALGATLTRTAPGRSASAAAPRLTVFAAASLTDVLPRIDRSPRYSFGGSNTLAAQLGQGAPADVFAAANTKLPRQLYEQGLVLEPIVFTRNELVLVVPRANPRSIRRVADLTHRGTRLVVAGADVPAGAYTRRVLQAMGRSRVLDDVVSEETDVRDVVAKVALGEADAGFVYATDAKAFAGRVVTIRLPASAQPSIGYSVAVVRTSRNRAAARAWVDRLVRQPAQAELAAAGFLPRRSQ